MINHYEGNCIHAITQFVEQKIVKLLDHCHFNHKILFRGVSDISYDMKPSLARFLSKEYSELSNNFSDNKVKLKIEKDIVSKERELLEIYIHKSRFCLGYTLTNVDKWKVLTHGQHHGLPTRLLDWTSDLLTAIFFSIENIFDNNGFLVEEDLLSDGVIYCISTLSCRDLETIEFAPFQNSIRCNYGADGLLLFRPPQFTERIRYQNGFCTAFEDPFNCMKSTFMENHEERWIINIPKKYKLHLFEQLMQQKPFPNYTYMGDYNSLSKDIKIKKYISSYNH